MGDARDPYAETLTRLERAAERAGIHRETVQRLRTPRLIVEARVPLRRDDGALDLISVWRVRHHDARGPAKGGIRFHPGVSLEEVKSLAFGMTLKGALFELPFGGGKGGVCVDPSTLSMAEMERLCRGVVRVLAPVLGPDEDVPAPDMNVNPRMMAWMTDEYAALQGRWSPASFTGKPPALGGSPGRSEATGRGAFVCLCKLLSERDELASETRVAIQGFGNAGRHLARLLHREGFPVVAVSDSSGGIYRDAGLDVPGLLEHKEAGSSVAEFEGGESLSNDELLALDVDVLAPSALGGVVHEGNASNVRASIVLEVANGPVSCGADPILHEAGITILPDLLANGGGVTVSYFEWLQSRAGEAWSIDQVHDQLEHRMTLAMRRVLDTASRTSTDLRTASWMVALRHIDAAVRALGVSEDYNGES